jgi:NAD-dependent DNA ligase
MPDIGEMYVLNERYGDFGAGSLAFFLGNNRYMFIEDNINEYIWSHSIFSKVEFTDKLKGKSVCITGTLEHPRDYYKKVIEINGGKFSSTVTKSLSFLIVSDDFLINEKYGSPSLKLAKARENGSKVLTFKQFLGLLR